MKIPGSIDKRFRLAVVSYASNTRDGVTLLVRSYERSGPWLFSLVSTETVLVMVS